MTSVKGTPIGNNPVNVAELIVVASLKMKSSAASVSRGPLLDGLEAMPINPSGEPVLKLNGVTACALGAAAIPKIAAPVSIAITKAADSLDEGPKADTREPVQT